MLTVPTDRRALLAAAGWTGLALAGRPGRSLAQAAVVPGAVLSGAGLSGAVLSGEDITLRLGRASMAIDGRRWPAIAVNGSVPGPLLRLRQGQNLRLTVINELDETTSLHWHGLELPFQMDGVPGVSFPGIAPGESFTYRFPITQHGTYWYHSHSGFQELKGVYGAIVIDPALPGEPSAEVEHDHVLLLSDHSPIPPERILRALKVDPGHFAAHPPTLAGLLGGQPPDLAARLDWAAKRMDPADIADVSGRILTYCVNGHGPQDNWCATYAPGGRVRLRFINGAGFTHFDVRIPGLALSVVAADGQDVRPVEVDEFQIAPGETFDVIVTPDGEAHTIVAEAMDRSALARATLAPRPGMSAPVPPLRAPVTLTMRDMGMEMGPESMGGNMGSGGMSMAMRDQANAPTVRLGPGVEMIVPMPQDRTGDPGLGLQRTGHRVLTYRDLVALAANPDGRAPEREIELHLTGAMDRYLWSFDGVAMGMVQDPLPLRSGERLRLTLINDTMMAHPIHLHGHVFDLVTGHGDHSPRKHTVNVLPGGKVSFDLTAAPGDWPIHCHLFLHMAMGMMRIVKVRPA